MAKAPGLYRPDGRPARQFGEEIIEPGKPFSGETLQTIRSLVTDTPQASPLIALAVDQSERHAPDPASVDGKKAKAEDPAKAMRETPTAPTTAPAKDAPEQAEPSDPTTPCAVDGAALNAPDSLPTEALPENFQQVLQSLDDFARDKLESLHDIKNNALDSLARDPGDSQVGMVAQGEPRAAKENWRRLIVVEGVPGRTLRRFFSKPRLIALAMLIGVSFWKPWFIPMLFLVAMTALVLMSIVAGADRVSSVVGWWYGRLQRRNPARADRLLHIGNRLLTRVEWLADRLPPAWVQGFHIPDLDAAVAPPEDDSQFQSRLERIAAQEGV